jgi:hypothetical protein
MVVALDILAAAVRCLRGGANVLAGAADSSGAIERADVV